MLYFVKKFSLVLVLIIAALIIYFLPFKMNYSFESYAKILPARQWMLVRGSDGFLLEGTKNILSGVNNFYRVNQFDRGATVEVNLNKTLESGSFVHEGDTLGVIYSSASYEKYVALKGQLKTSEAQLTVATSGEKESVIKAAEENLKLAISEADKQEKIAQRLKSLNEKKLASDEEYQLAADNLRSLKLTVEVRRSDLESVKSGLKESEVNQLKTYIESLKNELKTVEKQLASLHITAPFAGSLERIFSTDTLLILSDSEEFLAAIPVPIEDEVFLDYNSSAYLYYGDMEIKTDMLDLNNTVNLVSGKQCVTMISLIDQPGSKLNSGMIVKTKITGREITLREYFKSILYW